MDSGNHDPARPAERPLPEVTVVAIGIDNVAALEELFGAEMRRAIMAEIALRLARVVPGAAEMRQTPYHRFVLSLPRFDEDEVSALIDEMQARATAHPVDTVFGPVAVTLSAGCAVAGPGLSADTLMPAALHALHLAMLAGAGAVRVARDDSAMIAYRTNLMRASRAAITSDDLALAFQPVVRAEGSNTISFHECLVRIRRPEGGLLTAAAFMPAIERLGLAPMIDRQVLTMTAEMLARHPGARLSMNIFSHTMQDRQWMALFDDMVRGDPTLAERLIVEVTESAALLDLDRTRTFMDRLRAAGVSFAIDDFGAGHTSLRFLRELRFDILKIDGRFIREVDGDDDNAFLVGEMVRIARRFDMMTVAELVQTPSEARCLTRLGVEFFQGFHFGSPSLILEPTLVPMPAVAAQA